MRLLLIVSGGIAAYKSLDFIRLARRAGYRISTILTKAGTEFVTPLALSALSQEKVYQDLFSLTEESEMGHIRLAREADLILVAPASADIIGKYARGLANDLASTVLLATRGPVLVAPAMNVEMWRNPAVAENVTLLARRGVHFVGPDEGEMACGEYGEGRLVDPAAILAACDRILGRESLLAGKRALVTSGPTFEPIDPVRFIGNRSSGKQGHAIAAALAWAGAETILVTGPVNEPDPDSCTVVHVETAREMQAACKKALPADIAVCAAAVADWRAAETHMHKIKKDNGAPPALSLIPNPDILSELGAAGHDRPRLVVGFAAETENLLVNAQEKRRHKGCDWILANRVQPGLFGGERNQLTVVDGHGIEEWPEMTKQAVAQRLTKRIGDFFATGDRPC
ncbi:MAG TPA: bifunctional phosphopantothenoylcysteine decarboxylase/phosphopantothenate--cysteine ligase CoaBC [Dongiaceae bacterium]|jgi:phosphopantothenoylcysteine decarboxylase/phosphopantothenate--cysteine ligase|nr:bifunctional phosphopantothenoylcysteine decarboxylase/phosphopantothenate--cysteine ligase CoaBC [Dongiaceae bacterium]